MEVNEMVVVANTNKFIDDFLSDPEKPHQKIHQTRHSCINRAKETKYLEYQLLFAASKFPIYFEK